MDTLRIDETDDHHTVLRLLVVDRVSTDYRNPRLARFFLTATQNLSQDRSIQFLDRESDDVESEQRSATHRVDVAYGVRCCDRTERVRIVDDRCEEIERRDKGFTSFQRVHRPIVGILESYEHSRLRLAAERFEHAGQVLRT